MKVTTVGLDLAKSVFQVHGVDERGQRVVAKRLRREQVVEFFARLEPCLVGMEACGGAHYWAGKLQALGHTVRLMSPQFVKPYVKTNKNDARDAEAICEAVGRPNMRFVPVKSVEQQTVLSVHRARASMVKMRTAQANQIRGLLAEFGYVIAPGNKSLREQLARLLGQDSALPVPMRSLLEQLLALWRHLDEQARQLERQIELWHRQSEASRRLAQIPGVGPITASALLAAAGADARQFRNGRQLAAWIGLVPRQHSTGGRQVLLGISKRGDPYLRALLIHGARSVIRVVRQRALAGIDTGANPWAQRLVQRRNANVAAVALANKNARTAWALLAHGASYQARLPVPA